MEFDLGLKVSRNFTTQSNASFTRVTHRFRAHRRHSLDVSPSHKVALDQVNTIVYSCSDENGHGNGFNSTQVPAKHIKDSQDKAGNAANSSQGNEGQERATSEDRHEDEAKQR